MQPCLRAMAAAAVRVSGLWLWGLQVTVEDCQGQRDGGRAVSLQHVVNPKQKTGESLFMERFKGVCVGVRVWL